MEGWIKLHRKLLEWEWYGDSKMVHLLFHLIASANHKDNNWRGIKVKRGQVIVGYNELSSKTGISIQSLRTCIKKLKSTGEVTVKTTNKYSLVTILKYDSYQINEDTNKQTNNQLTINQQSTNNQLTTNKNVKKEKNENNTNSKVFYDNEINTNENTDIYRSFVNDLHDNEYAIEFLKLKTQVTFKNFNNLLKESKLKNKRLSKEIESMLEWGANKPKFYKDKSNAYLTLLSWIKRG